MSTIDADDRAPPPLHTHRDTHTHEKNIIMSSSSSSEEDVSVFQSVAVDGASILDGRGGDPVVVTGRLDGDGIPSGSGVEGCRGGAVVVLKRRRGGGGGGQGNGYGVGGGGSTAVEKALEVRMEGWWASVEGGGGCEEEHDEDEDEEEEGEEEGEGEGEGNSVGRGCRLFRGGGLVWSSPKFEEGANVRGYGQEYKPSAQHVAAPPSMYFPRRRRVDDVEEGSGGDIARGIVLMRGVVVEGADIVSAAKVCRSDSGALPGRPQQGVTSVQMMMKPAIRRRMQRNARLYGTPIHDDYV